jgi:DNA-binding PadR family transcriptional regulator
MERASLPEFGRFAEPALLILVSLSEGPTHGYAIMTDIEAGSG